MRVIVCGGRLYDDYEMVLNVLAFIGHNPTIVHGAATGADTCAERAAEYLGLKTEVYPADWELHGKAAGPIRNREMLKAGADLIIAFPGGRGTAHMMNIARIAGVPVLEVKL